MGKVNRERFTAEQVVDALRDARGFVTVAARALGCSPRTVTNYAQRHTSVRQALDDARDERLDFAEGKLMELIRDGNVAAVIFFLKTQGKARGYIERAELTGAEGSPLMAPSWIEIRTAVMAALVPYPDARAAVADRLLHRSPAPALTDGDNGRDVRGGA